GRAPAIRRRRAALPSVSKPLRRNWCGRRRGGTGRLQDNRLFADPSSGASHGLMTKWGEPASVSTEYREHGLHLKAANNNRRAGYLRLLELLHVEPGRIPPPWASIGEGVDGATSVRLPRLRAADRAAAL